MGARVSREVMGYNPAVRAERATGKESLDHFPTPRWATRALCEYVIDPVVDPNDQDVWEPACGEGFMAETLAEYFNDVYPTDIAEYGYGARQMDFLRATNMPCVHWTITNPPFKHAAEFVLKGLKVSKIGVAVLVRTAFLESAARYVNLFKPHKPYCIAQFVERVPMVQGRMDAKATTMTAYAWVVWRKDSSVRDTKMMWIPPCRANLERPGDYAATWLDDKSLVRKHPR